mmetsp:Transcript_14666/g.36628  ORF Transcript_14666/g.36628 Transcript_14666/m.36628 type:complete len:530 (-) Transcript_14666:93-1682(-)
MAAAMAVGTSKSSGGQPRRKYDLIVFGATGFTGRLCIRYLLKENDPSLRWAIHGRDKEKLAAALADACEKEAIALGDDNLKNKSEQTRPELVVSPLVFFDTDQAVAGRVPDASSGANSSNSSNSRAEQEAALRAIVESAKVCISCAGPFAKYGCNLVRLCAETGTDYCDITGETDFVRDTIRYYHGLACQTGARLVPHCGCDCVPWDLTFALLAAELQKEEKIVALRTYAEFPPSASASGGTIATVYYHAVEKKQAAGEGSSSSGGGPLGGGGAGGGGGSSSKTGLDPLFWVEPAAYDSDRTFTFTGAAGGGDERGNDDVDEEAGSKNKEKVKKYHAKVERLHKATKVEEIGNRTCSNWIMAPVMGNCIRRTNALLRVSDNLCFRDCVVDANESWASFFRLLVFGLSLRVGVLRWFLQKCVVRPPGSGPTEEAMDEGYLTLVGFADAVAGRAEPQNNGGLTKYRSEMKFFTDVGYKDTARMLVESGLCLLRDVPKGEFAGVGTPGAVMGEKLLARLMKKGRTTWQVAKL